MGYPPAFSWRDPRSPRAGCWRWRTRSSRRSDLMGARPVADYESVIGLEIHVQLQTRTKMFCGSELSFGDEPNVHTCPVCLGLPGALPVINEQAVRYAVMIGFAFGSEIAQRSQFHRQNDFHPDNPE